MSDLRLRGKAVLVSGMSILLLMAAKPPTSKKIPPGVKELAIGSKAPGFELIGTDDKLHALGDLKGDQGTLVVFTCNHCPFAIKYQDRIIALTEKYQKQGISVVAISCNDAGSFADDSFPNMKIRAKEKEFNFPYLYDESQAVALEYGPMVTPHIFLFDSELTLVYRGRIDDSAKEDEVKKRELTDALNALVAGKEIPVAVTTAFGCSIKWKPAVLEAGKPMKTESTGS
jgi:peroxiredoxin